MGPDRRGSRVHIPEGSGSDYIPPLWLSHHRVGEEARCTTVAGVRVCRRCLWLWPLTAVALLASGLVGLWPVGMDESMLTFLPVPAVLEFIAEMRGWANYDPRRQILTSIPLAAALGRGFALYLEDPTNRLFWQMVGVYGGLCLLAAMSRSSRGTGGVP